MGTALTKKGDNPLAYLATEEGMNAFADAANDMAVGDGLFGKFSGNTGDYTYGMDNEEIEHGTEVLVNMMDAFRGYLCWIGGDVEDRVIVPLIDGKPPLERDLPDHGPYDKEDGWGPTCGFSIALEDGTQINLVFNSKGGQRSFGKFVKEFAKGMHKNPGLLPVITLDANSFETKNSRGKKYAPVFEIVDWCSPEDWVGGSDYEDDGEDQGGDDAPDDTADEREIEGELEVKKGRKSATASKPKDETKADAPPRRRRRNNV